MVTSTASDLASSRANKLSSSWHGLMNNSSGVFKSFLAGSISGTCSTILFQPLDLVKTRVQSSISSGTPIGVIGAIRSVESVGSFWRGTTPSLARCVPGIGIYFGALHWINTTVKIEKPGMIENGLMGASARTVAGVLVLPFTVVKTRFESKDFAYRGLAKALTSIYKTEGFKGLFSGLVPTLMRDVPYSGLYLMFYLKIKQSLPTGKELQNHSLAVHFSAGLVAGMLASLSTQPADVLKTHSQLYPQKFRRLKIAAAYVYQNDGITGFFRGMLPRALKRTLVGAMAWTVYEELMQKMGLKTV